MQQPEVISRADALARGLLRYFTGKPCKNGHVAERQASNHTCMRCAADRSGADYKENRETRIAKTNAHYHANAERLREGMREAYRRRVEADPDCNRKVYAKFRGKRIQESREWAKANPEKRRAQHVKRKAAKRKAVPGWYGEFDDLVAIEAADLCRLRAAVTGFDWHTDHMVPLLAREACGLHCAANLQVIPASMNMNKKNKMRLTEPGEWLRWI